MADDRVDAARAAAIDQGWRIEPIKKGEAWYPPDRRFTPVMFHRTPSDWRSFQNQLSKLRQRGFIWPWPPGKG